MEKQNRAERRRNKFGGGRATEHGGWPTVQPNPVFDDANAPGEPEAPPTATRTPEPKSTPETDAADKSQPPTG